MAEPIHVVVDDDTETIRVDPVTGTVETDQPDGGVVVQLDAHKKKSDDADNEDEFYRNLADEVGDLQLGQVANELIEAISADDTSRGEYLAIRARGLGLLGTKIEDPKADLTSSGAVEGMSVVTNPLLLEACLKGWANAQAELLPSDGPLKIRDDGDETKGEDELAEALERDVNHYLTKTATEYYPDTSHMLLWGTYFGGSGIKKVARCPLRRRPVSESVDVKDFIVSDTTKDLRSCARLTHQIPMRPSVMKRMMMIGAYRKATLTQPTPTPNAVDAKIAGIQGTAASPSRPEDQPYTLWETQCELDLPDFAPKKFADENIPLPYLVTIDKDSREILSIRRDWKEDDEHCERKRMYVKYPYVPGPGFYGTGLLNILGNCSAAMTAAWREALDAGMFASFPSFLISKLTGRQNSSDLRVAPGTGVPIETNNMPIQQVAMALPYKDVTPGLMSLIDKISQAAKEVGGTADLPVGEGIQNVPVGTMMAQIEQATKIMAAAHKGMHQAQSEELDLILDLFRENPEDFWKSNKVAPKDYWNEQKFIQALDNTNLVPVSDPNVPSHMHRVAKAVALVQLSNDPKLGMLLDPMETLKRVLAVMREDPQGLVVMPAPQPAQPDPKMLDAAAKMKSADAKMLDATTKGQTAGKNMELANAKLAVQQDVAHTDLKKELVIHAADQQKEARQAALDQAAHAHTVKQAGHDSGVDMAKLGLAAQQQTHDQAMDKASHALDVHTALNPPEPASGQ